jgi:hypothetical protein
MRALRVAGLACLFFFGMVATSTSGGTADCGTAPLRSWDSIVSATFFADIADFERAFRQESGERVYTFFALDKEGKLTLSVVVAIGPVGSRLPPEEWQAAVASADPARRERDFPDIGARARAQVPRFSPDGALSSVTFATRDGFFDVTVSVFEASGKAERPPLTAGDAARRIDDAYDATCK